MSTVTPIRRRPPLPERVAQRHTFRATYAVPMMAGCIGDFCDTVIGPTNAGSLEWIDSGTQDESGSVYALINVRGPRELHTELTQDYVQTHVDD